MNTYKNQHVYLGVVYLCLLIITPMLTVARPIIQKPGKYKADIQIIIKDSAILNNGPDIQFKVYLDGINSGRSLHTDFINIKLEGIRTDCKIPLSTRLNYVKVTYKYKPKSLHERFGYLLSEVNNLYLVEAGDKIQITFNKRGVRFNGKGSEKLSCIYEVYSHRKKGNIDVTSYYKSGDYVNAVRALKNQEDSLYNVKMAVLARYKLILEPEVYQLYLADIWANYNSKVVGLFYSTLVYNDKVPTSAISKVYSDFKSTLNLNFLPIQILANSFNYCDFLYNFENFNHNYLNRLHGDKSNYIERISASINHNYSGVIKDKLRLVTSYRILNILPNFLPFLDYSINNALENKYKIALNQLKKNITEKAYPFELPDSNGKIYKLEDFKGKLIIMDFWFTGCLPCQLLATELHPIIEQYSNNLNIVFVSVSIDGLRNKKLWLESLANKKYSSNNAVNLLALEGINSKIIQHYNITRFPTLLIISKTGQVITTTPPRPGSSISGSTENFKNFIASHLK